MKRSARYVWFRLGDPDPGSGAAGALVADLFHVP